MVHDQLCFRIRADRVRGVRLQVGSRPSDRAPPRERGRLRGVRDGERDRSPAPSRPELGGLCRARLPGRSGDALAVCSPLALLTEPALAQRAVPRVRGVDGQPVPQPRQRLIDGRFGNHPRQAARRCPLPSGRAARPALGERLPPARRRRAGRPPPRSTPDRAVIRIPAPARAPLPTPMDPRPFGQYAHRTDDQNGNRGARLIMNRAAPRGNEEEPHRKRWGSSTYCPVRAMAEDTRFELVRGCPQHAFQACALGH